MSSLQKNVYAAAAVAVVAAAAVTAAPERDVSD
jgi:hypothetical protein